ncbi:MAG: hypothetical protein ABTS16_21210 [Candidatus Accumulibacter phosphatis]|uniref:Uncharacterized protein n=1 Tax=Candidatus Accumulibacter contiguus TaxID=2954381 RepID=A0ABX1T8H2_9PROT|nr:hypothetical protein [Candidatus Accumulibacter contiguus]NMQ05271.1 hypothetical protein [Candidatus Accumulibacter contiguus]
MTMRPEICREDIADLAHVASELDFMKNRCASDAWKNLLIRAVEVMHRVGTRIDAAQGYHVYGKED